jgi:mono/diheme cytochrome c family protein
LPEQGSIVVVLSRISRGKLTAALVLVSGLAGALLLASCSSPLGAGTNISYSSNGERIYFTATSSSGRTITSSGGIMMHQMACVNCHGPDGHGGRVNMMMWTLDVPDITWHNLTGEAGHDEPEGGEEHEEHPPYTEESLKRAITRGIDPAGEPLDRAMPRWRMSQADLDDLVDFIKVLD